LSRPCFEISFELRSAPVILKTERRNHLPRTVFGCVGRSASVVCPEALLKVGGDAYVSLRGNSKALEQIDIFHDCPLAYFAEVVASAMKAGRQGFGGHYPSL
jgi:hypothetical protein